MAYRLEPGRPIADEIRRVLQEEARAAAQQLRNAKGPDGSEAIHEARKSVKKIRAVLRLARAALGSQTYRQENIRFREIGRTLSELRDAGAMLETFQELHRRYHDQIDGQTWDALRQSLFKRKQQTEQSANEHQILVVYPQELEKTVQEWDQWPMQEGDLAVLFPGLKAAFRQGRKTMALAQRSPSPENFHQWRKRVKDHWYHVRLLEKAWTPMMAAYGDVLKNIQTWLGDDHNLTVLRETALKSERNGRNRKNALLDIIERHQADLRQQALVAGVRIYAPKPKQLAAALEFLWNAPLEKDDASKEL